jgi:hypothetical protein
LIFGEEKIVGWQRGWSSSCWFASGEGKQRGDEWPVQIHGPQRRGEVLWLLRWGEEGTRLWLVLLQLDGRIREGMAWLLVCSFE